MTVHDSTQKSPQSSASVPDPDTELNLDPDPGDPTPAPPPAPSTLDAQVREIEKDSKYAFVASLIAAVLSLIGVVVFARVPDAWGYEDTMGLLVGSSVFFMLAMSLSIMSGMELWKRWQASVGSKPVAIAGLLICIGTFLTALILDIISKIQFVALLLDMALHG